MLSGDVDAYATLVERYQDRVYGVCLKMTHDAEAAEVLAQEVFIKAFTSLASFRGEASFSTWLYQIAVRRCLDWRRKLARDKPFQAYRDVPESVASDEQNPEEAFLEEERRQTALAMLATLEEPYRSTVNLFYIEGKSYQEIAAMTGVSVKTVESRLYRARRALRERGDA